MTDHADTIRLREVSEALLEAWRTTDPEEGPPVAYYEFRDAVQPEAVLALLAERQQLLDGISQAQFYREKAEAERQQAIDALRRAREDIGLIAKTTFDMGMDGRIRRAERSCERIDAALVKLGDKP